MQIALAADHAGYALKEELFIELSGAGHVVMNMGTSDPSVSSDYPDFAELVCDAVRAGKAERGLLVCGSGVGVSVAANKFPGVRAGLCHDTYSAHQGVEHDDMNVLCMGSRIIGGALAKEIVRAFLGARFSAEERHARRLKKVQEIEARFLR